jgi:hypothetical protein
MAVGIFDFPQYQQEQVNKVEAYIDARLIESAKSWPRNHHLRGCTIHVTSDHPDVGDFHYLAFVRELVPKYLARGWSDIKWEDSLFKFIYKNPNECK